MKRVVLKILRQEPTSPLEWQNLFAYLSRFFFLKYIFIHIFRLSRDVYSVSTWQPISIPEIFTELSNEITRHIKQAQEVKI
jgi:hypothetical protein